MSQSSTNFLSKKKNSHVTKGNRLFNCGTDANLNSRNDNYALTPKTSDDEININGAPKLEGTYDNFTFKVQTEME